MMQDIVLKHEFVEFIPDELQEGTIYVSIRFATATHLCCCGCGNKVITPLRPKDWKLVFDGKTISLDPSIGNWSFACQSHYWIVRNNVKWARPRTQEEVRAGRTYDTLAKDEYFGTSQTPAAPAASPGAAKSEDGKPREGVWRKLKRFLFGK
jgi:hypothetical protein